MSTGTTPNLARPKDKPGSGSFTGRISVIASNTPSSLANIANAVAKQEGRYRI